MNPGLITVMLFFFLSFVGEILPHTNRPMEEEKEGEYGEMQPVRKNGKKRWISITFTTGPSLLRQMGQLPLTPTEKHLTQC